MAGLFSTPQQASQQRQDKLFQQATQMYDNPIARATYLANAQLASGIGGLFGFKDPAEAQASKIQEITSQVQLDENADPYAYYTDLARRLVNAGMTQAGNEALAMAAKVKPATPKPTELSTEAYKEVMKASAGARTAQANVQKANSLMSRYQALKPTGGLVGKVGSWLKSVFGAQDEQSRLKADFEALVNSAVIDNLPPGPATDKDIELIQKGFPDATWSRQEIEGWLEAYRDAAEFQAFYEGERAKYMNANRGLDVDFPNAIKERAAEFRKAQVARREASRQPEQEGPKPTGSATFDANLMPPGADITTSPGSAVNQVQSQPGAAPGTMTVPTRPVYNPRVRRGVLR